MFTLKRMTVAALAAAAVIAPVTAASASTASAPARAATTAAVSGPQGNLTGTTYTAATRLAGRPDSGGNGNWANDSYTRTAIVTVLGIAPASRCGEASGSCYAMIASLADRGTFTTVPGAYAPNQGAPHTGQLITGPAVTGPMHGYGLFSEFFSPVLPSPRLVPGQVTGSAYPSYQWPALFFPAGTTLTGMNEQYFGYFYNTGSQHWVDADFNQGGQAYGSGQITK